MIVVAISRALRLGLEAAFALQFNAELRAACDEFGIKIFSFNWGRAEDGPRNCFVGNRGFEDLAREGADFPAATWWVGTGQDMAREKPRRFSGPVEARWRFFLVAKGRYQAAALVDRREAVEAAIQATLVRMDVVEGRYHKNLTWGDPVEMQWLDQDNQHIGWVQVVEYSASFEVNV